MKKNEKNGKDEQASVLRRAMIQPTSLPQEEGSHVIPAWASVLLIIFGGLGLVFGLVRLVKFAWYF